MPAVLVVADPDRVTEIQRALADPLPNGNVDVLVSSGGDDTIDLFESRSPRVVVLTATLEVGDAKSLIEALRAMVPRGHVVIVLIGDDATGVVRTALDAIDMKPDRFVSRPLADKALRFAVQSGLENVARSLGEPVQGTADEDRITGPSGSRGGDADSPVGTLEGAAGSSPVIFIGPRPAMHSNAGMRDALEVIGDDDAGASGSIDISTDDIDDQAVPAIIRAATPLRGSAPTREARNGDSSKPPAAPAVGRAPTDRGLGARHVTPATGAPITTGTPTSGPASAPLRARWEALADSIAHDDLLDDDDVELSDDDVELLDDSALPLPPIEIGPRTKGGTNPDFLPVPPVAPWRPGTTSAVSEDEIEPPQREPTLIIDDASLSQPNISGGTASGAITSGAQMSSSSLTMPSLSSSSLTVPSTQSSLEPHPSLVTPIPSLANPPAQAPNVAGPGPHERWSHPRLLSELIDRSRDSSLELLAHVKEDLAALDGIDDDIIVGHPRSTPPPHALRSGQLDALENLIEPVPPPELGLPSLELPPTRPSSPSSPPPVRPSSPILGRFGGGSGTSPGFTSGGAGADSSPTPERLGAGRDFARQLRAKMSQMAQRLFQSDSPAQPSVDIRPRHDHHTEIDLASLGEEPALGGGVTEIERGHHREIEPRSLTTSPGSWDTQVRERGMPDAGEIVRGVSDIAMILARMFAQSFTGRVSFRRDNVVKIVHFDGGRPVFASSNEAGDRMGELLVREGKITASQYERCQVHVEQSGRRMGEILVDFGYLKRRELLPAVRRHVEDILYSLFGWDDGSYQVAAESTASAERIRLSRHPASLVMEGIRRKLDRTTLEKMIGPPSTIIEVPDKERLGGIISAGDLAGEERAALTGFDGHADLAQVARTIGVDVADVLPFAWGLCVLGLATARRTEPDVPDESTALVGETDLAIDRERVRARWQLVTEADYFALLGVRREATAFEIRRAYQAARRDFAAECFPNDLRRELAQELEDISSVLDEAFRVLRDDRLRLTYLANLVE